MGGIHSCETVAAEFGAIEPKGELRIRLERSFARLTGFEYSAQSAFDESRWPCNKGWPGDVPGRTFLALVLESRALGVEPDNLKAFLDEFPKALNERGYMGPVRTDVIDEQVLAGNGWVLRGLCEYWEWKHDPKTKEMIARLARGLFLPGKGRYAAYPIDPKARKANVGEAAGESVGVVDGCVAIGLDGLVHAWKVTGDPELKAVIDELVPRFLAIDFEAIRAQTHATLTGARALIRCGRIADAVRIFDLYVRKGMTEAYENYNWFGRYDTWTEPCAIVDSYLVTMQLWQATGEQRYLDLGERIYYNAICRTQHRNGGFGIDGCPGKGYGTRALTVRGEEAWWCCTMRGGEGLARALQYAFFTDGDTVLAVQPQSCVFRAKLPRGELVLEEVADYPFGTNVTFRILSNTAGEATLRVLLGGKDETFRRNFRAGEEIVVALPHTVGKAPVVLPENCSSGDYRLMDGPLVLGRFPDGTLKPIHHVLDSRYWKDDTDPKPQVLFSEAPGCR